MKVVHGIYGGEALWGIYEEDTQTVKTDWAKTKQIRSFEEVISLVAGAKDLPHVVPFGEVQLLAPVLPTKNVLCIGKNY